MRRGCAPHAAQAAGNVARGPGLGAEEPLQHAAVAHVADCDGLAHASIDLPIDIDAVRPLKPVEPVGGGAFLERIGATGEPLCFVVPDVAFRVLSERVL